MNLEIDTTDVHNISDFAWQSIIIDFILGKARSQILALRLIRLNKSYILILRLIFLIYPEVKSNSFIFISILTTNYEAVSQI